MKVASNKNKLPRYHARRRTLTPMTRPLRRFLELCPSFLKFLSGYPGQKVLGKREMSLISLNEHPCEFQFTEMTLAECNCVLQNRLGYLVLKTSRHPKFDTVVPTRTKNEKKKKKKNSQKATHLTRIVSIITMHFKSVELK